MQFSIIRRPSTHHRTTADYEGISPYLSQVDWQSMMSHNLTRYSLWSSFCNILQTAVDLYLPTRPESSPTPCSFVVNNQKRYPRVIRETMCRRRCLWRLRRQHPADSADWYRTACMECRQLINDYEKPGERPLLLIQTIWANFTVLLTRGYLANLELEPYLIKQVTKQF